MYIFGYFFQKEHIYKIPQQKTAHQQRTLRGDGLADDLSSPLLWRAYYKLEKIVRPLGYAYYFQILSTSLYIKQMIDAVAKMHKSSAQFSIV